MDKLKKEDYFKNYIKKENYKQDFKLKKNIEIVDILIALTIIGLCIVSLVSYGFYNEELKREIGLYGKIGVFAMTLFLELVPNLLNPYIVLIVGIGSGINVFLAVLLSCAGSAAGSMIGFEVGKKYGLRFVQPFFRQKSLEKIFDFWKKYGKWFVFAAALTPLPYVPLIFGAFGMKRKDFLIFGIAARLAGLAAVGFAIYFGFL